MATVNSTPPVLPLEPTSSVTAKANSGAATSEVVTSASAKTVTVPSGSTITTISPAAEVPPFSIDKVKELKLAIENGVFEVNSKIIAEKLISDANDLRQPVEASE